jgi:hydrogenase maturation protein HypF
MHRLLARMAARPARATANATSPEANLRVASSDAVLAAQSEAAALFHVALADALARAAITAARQHQVKSIALSGGCFFNRILRTRMVDILTQAGLSVHLPHGGAYGDAGIALGQAWVAAHILHAVRSETESKEQATRDSLCV